MNTVERVARAIFRAERGYESDMCPVTDMLWPTGEEWRNQAWAQFEPAARAAIEALREPTEDMMKEAWRSQFKFVGASDDEANTLVQMRSEKDLHFDLSRLGWASAIDAALNEGKEET